MVFIHLFLSFSTYSKTLLTYHVLVRSACTLPTVQLPMSSHPLIFLTTLYTYKTYTHSFLSSSLLVSPSSPPPPSLYNTLVITVDYTIALEPIIAIDTQPDANTSFNMGDAGDATHSNAGASAGGADAAVHKKGHKGQKRQASGRFGKKSTTDDEDGDLNSKPKPKAKGKGKGKAKATNGKKAAGEKKNANDQVMAGDGQEESGMQKKKKKKEKVKTRQRLTCYYRR